MSLARCTLLATLVAGGAFSAPILTLDPSPGNISGLAGSTIGWGFTLSPDAVNWTLITAVQMNVTSIGFFQDYLSAWVSANAFALGPGAAPLVQSFIPGVPGADARGVAGVTINPNAPLGPITGFIDISYELYDADPFLGGNLVSVGNSFTPAFQITVSDIPEPGTASLLAAAALALLCVRRRPT